MQSDPCDPEAGEDVLDDVRTGSRSAPGLTTLQRLHLLLRERRHGELRDELARAEIAGEISEFHALDLQALLAMIEGSDLAGDYLEMAEAVACSPCELAIVAEHRAAHDLLQGDPFTAAERCLDTLDHVYQSEGLWNHLLIALDRLGEVEAIDATLRSFARLDDECVARLEVRLLAEPHLRGIRDRRAFMKLLERRAAG